MSVFAATLADVAAVLTGCGLMAVLLGLFAVRHFAPRAAGPASDRPAISVMKPLCGDEPELDTAIATMFAQTYPAFEIVFGVQDARDPALAAIERVRAGFPDRDISIVIDPTPHGPNRKVGNLINMLHAAHHDILVFSDSDLHVAPDYLDRIADALAEPGTGLVTSVCVGLPTTAGLVARLGATAISHSFLPGALMARALGREDCLGTTMALRRETLARVGGLEALVRHLADDNVLAGRVRALGLRVGLARTVPGTAVPEASFAALWQHELRWARTIRALEPALFAVSAMQYPLFWAAASVLLSLAAPWSLAVFAGAWAVRACAARHIDRVLSPHSPIRAPVWLLPLRDIMSVAGLVASYNGDGVVWRGHSMHADDGRLQTVPLRSGRLRTVRSGSRAATDPDRVSKPASAPAAG